MNFDKGVKVSKGSFLKSLISPITFVTVPTIQRFNYWWNMKLLGDYETFRINDERLSPYILEPLSSLSGYVYQPILHFQGADESQFRKEIEDGTHIIIANHVGYSDFCVMVQIARYYHVLDRFIAYFMKSLKGWPILGPSLWGQIPLARDGSEKDKQTLEDRLETFAYSEHEHIFMLFPEGGLKTNPKLWERTKRKNQESQTNLKYVNYPKVTGFSKLIDICGEKVQNIYLMTLLYNHKNMGTIGNEVHVVIQKICKASEVPNDPSGDSFSVREKFLEQQFIKMDKILEDYYSSYEDDEKPTVENTVKKHHHIEESLDQE